MNLLMANLNPGDSSKANTRMKPAAPVSRLEGAFKSALQDVHQSAAEAPGHAKRDKTTGEEHLKPEAEKTADDHEDRSTTGEAALAPLPLPHKLVATLASPNSPDNDGPHSRMVLPELFGRRTQASDNRAAVSGIEHEAGNGRRTRDAPSGRTDAAHVKVRSDVARDGRVEGVRQGAMDVQGLTTPVAARRADRLTPTFVQPADSTTVVSIVRSGSHPDETRHRTFSREARSDAVLRAASPRMDGAVRNPVELPVVARAIQIEHTVVMQNQQLIADTSLERPTTSSGDPASISGLSRLVGDGMASGVQRADGERGMPATFAPTVEAETAVPRVIRSMHSMTNHRGGVMTMRLDPPELGQLRIRMTISQGVVSAQFDAETQAAQQILKQNLHMLKASLESQGLHVDRLHVNLSNQSHAQGDAGQRFQEDFNQQRFADAGGGESRGRREYEGHTDDREDARTASLIDNSDEPRTFARAIEGAET